MVLLVAEVIQRKFKLVRAIAINGVLIPQHSTELEGEACKEARMRDPKK